MREPVFLLFLFTAIVAGIQSCKYHNEEELYPDSNCEPDIVTFSGHVLPLIQTECATAGCHVSGTGRVILTDFGQLKGVVNDGRLRQQAIVTRNMPPDRPLTNCQIELLKTWIDQGAMNN